MYPACFLAFCTGFLSLSLEILWIRLFSFANHSMPQAFAFVLAVYLIGIALGAYIGKWFCKKSQRLWFISGLALILSSVVDLTGPWIYAAWAASAKQLIVGGVVIMLTALLKSIVFPISHHLGTLKVTANVGRHVSRVYAANIAGATLGPLFTGIFLLSTVTTQQSFVICAGLTFLIAMYCLVRSVSLSMAVSMATFAAAGLLGLVMMMNEHALILKIALPSPGKANQIVENQYGIVTVTPGGKYGDIVTGGNVYDGTTNLDPIINSNGINRVAVMSALVDQPKRILMIGLSIGTWLKIATGFPGVQHIDVVEINPGYLQLIKSYPAQGSGVLDPRVKIHITDGRRWLKEHPENKYDMIIMNTTYHWRAYSTNLLSQEFLQLLKSHMNKNAVLEYNATDSPDVLKTANSVFPFSFFYQNFVIAADFDWRKKLHAKQARKKLAKLTLGSKPFYPPGSAAIINRHLAVKIVPLSTVETYYNMFGRKLEIVTDWNMITEYKYGKTL